MSETTEENFFEEALKKISRGDISDYDAFLHTIEKKAKVDDTNLLSYWHCITLDGNGRDRTKDFVEHLFCDITDYVIPRSRINEAFKRDAEKSTTRYTAKLANEARTTFVDIAKSGELGELILFILAEKLLKLPQVICKMNLKTSRNMHFHGADGVYLGTTDSGGLALYWGESKIHRNLSNAVKECFESLSGLLTSQGGILSADNRDFILLKQFIDVDDKNLETALIGYLDRDNPNFNKLEIRAVAFVGFQNAHCYPQTPKTKTIQDVENTLLTKIPRFKKIIKTATIKNSLETFTIHFFCIPFKSVNDLRNEFHKCLGLPKV